MWVRAWKTTRATTIRTASTFSAARSTPPPTAPTSISSALAAGYFFSDSVGTDSGGFIGGSGVVIGADNNSTLIETSDAGDIIIIKGTFNQNCIDYHAAAAATALPFSAAPRARPRSAWPGGTADHHHRDRQPGWFLGTGLRRSKLDEGGFTWRLYWRRIAGRGDGHQRRRSPSPAIPPARPLTIAPSRAPAKMRASSSPVIASPIR